MSQKRDHFKRKFHLPTIDFQRIFVSFRVGVTFLDSGWVFSIAVCFRMRLDYNIPKQMQAEALEGHRQGGFGKKFPMGEFVS